LGGNGFANGSPPLGCSNAQCDHPGYGALDCQNEATVSGALTLTADTTIYTALGCTLDGAIGGPYQLTVTAASGCRCFVQISGASTYSGGTVLSTSNPPGVTGAGGQNFAYANGASSLGSGPVTVLPNTSGWILGGLGTVGDVTSAGAVEGGDPTGTLSVGNLSLAGGSFETQINSASDYSAVDASGAVTIVPATSLVVTLDYTPALGTSFTIIHNTSGSPVTGNFAGLPQGAVFQQGGTYLAVTYHGGTGHDIVLTTVAPPTPTPSSTPTPAATPTPTPSAPPSPSPSGSASPVIAIGPVPSATATPLTNTSTAGAQGSGGAGVWPVALVIGFVLVVVGAVLALWRDRVLGKLRAWFGRTG